MPNAYAFESFVVHALFHLWEHLSLAIRTNTTFSEIDVDIYDYNDIFFRNGAITAGSLGGEQNVCRCTCRRSARWYDGVCLTLYIYTLVAT